MQALKILLTGFVAGLLAACAPTLTGDYAFTNVSVVDATNDEVLDNQTVVVEAGRIIHVGATDAIRLAAKVEQIAGEGAYLAPGLADMHAHVQSADDLILYLANGVTTIRNMWGEPSLLTLTQAVEAGEVPGPRMINAGRMVDGTPAIHFGTVELTDPAQAEDLMKSQIDAGYDFVKIYSRMSPEVFEAVDAASQATGIPYAGHLPRAVPLSRGLASRMRTMEHFYGVFEEAAIDFPDPQPNFFMNNEQAVELQSLIGSGAIEARSLIDEERFAQIKEQVGQSQVWHVPTFEVLKIFTSRGPKAHPEADRFMSLAVRRFWGLTPSLLGEVPPDVAKGRDAMFQLQLDLASDLREAGARFLVGTDAPNPGVYPGYSVVDEMENFVAAGFSRSEAIRAATSEPAEFLGRRGEFGAVAQGASADLILLEGNPLENLYHLRNPELVMVGGRLYSRQTLDQMLEDISSRYNAIEAVFAEAPVFPPEVFFPADFLGPDGKALRMGRALSESGETAIHVAFLEDGIWQNFRIKGKAQSSDGNDAGDPAWEVVSQTGLAAGRAPLTGTPLDILVLDTLVGPLNAGDVRKLDLADCEAGLSCDLAKTKSIELRGHGVEVIDGFFYYTGTRRHEVREVADDSKSFTYWVGGGQFYGGMSIRIDLENGEEWTRVR